MYIPEVSAPNAANRDVSNKRYIEGKIDKLIAAANVPILAPNPKTIKYIMSFGISDFSVVDLAFQNVVKSDYTVVLEVGIRHVSS